MNEADHWKNPDASAIVPIKRKRGRPRKYPRLDLDHGGNASVPRDQKLTRGENAHAPPGFGGSNGNRPLQVDAANDANDIMVGQVVHGVIEATFDAGYLLTVRVGNSENTLRGVVFKSGHYVPVSDDNDVAPGVQMIRRNDIFLPTVNYNQVHSHNSRSRSRNGTAQAARATYSVVSKDKLVPSIVTQPSPPGISRGNIVPVVLQPVNLSNGVPAGSELSPGATQAPPHMVASKGKQVLDAVHPSNGSTPTNQVLHFQPQNNHMLMPLGMQNETGAPNHNPTEVLNKAEAKAMNVPGMPFKKLLTEVINRIQVPSQLMEPTSSSAGKSSVKDYGITGEDDVSDTDKPLTVEPLQTVMPDRHSHPAAASRPLESFRTGRMTELLQVLQENMMENQAIRAEEPAAVSTLKVGDLKSPETELRDKDGDCSKEHSQASSV